MNKDEAIRALEISQSAWAAGNHEKALRFAKKTLALHSTAAGIAWLTQVTRNLSEEGDRDGDDDGGRGQSSFRRRTNATAGATKQQSAPPPESSQREYTEEQLAAVRRIQACREDYYAALGVERSATQAELKKAYRKLALQFHPDKNSAPGASDAFKIIGSAYATLGDEEKKAVYDRYGIQGLRRGGTSTAYAQEESDFMFRRGGPRHRQQHHAHFEPEISPEELFNMFFGGLAGHGMRGGGATFTFGPDGHTRFHQPGMRQQPRRRQNEGGAGMAPSSSCCLLLMQALPLLLFVFLSIFNPFSLPPSEPDRGFSLLYTSRHSMRRDTLRQKVPYFVNPAEYAHYLKNDPRRLRQLEDRVEVAFVRQLQEFCMEQRRKKQMEMERARTPEELEQAEKMSLSSCETLERLAETKK